MKIKNEKKKQLYFPKKNNNNFNNNYKQNDNNYARNTSYQYSSQNNQIKNTKPTTAQNIPLMNNNILKYLNQIPKKS